MQGPNRTLTNALQVTPGTPVSPGLGVLISATVAGTQNIELKGGQTIPVSVPVGATLLRDIAVVDAPSGGTATATVFVLS